MKKINLGIIGAGHIAEKVSRTLVQMPGICCKAVASRDLEKARSFAARNGYERAYGSYEELVMDRDIDLVYVATPHSLHFEHTGLCLKHGKHVICEKAFTATAAQASELVALARRNSLVLAEAMWTRYMPFSKTIREVMESGIIGIPRLLTASLGYSITWKERVMSPALCGGALLDLGVYCINFALMTFGDEIADVSSSCVKSETGVDLQECINWTYKDGRMVVLSVSACAATDRRAVISGTEGKMLIDNVNNPRELVVLDKMDKPLGVWNAPACISGYEYEFEAVCDAISGGLSECPQMPLSESVKVMEMADSLRREWGVVFPMDSEIIINHK